MTTQPPGWYPDPVNANRQRWWDGNAWGVHVASNGTTRVEPLPPTTPTTARASRRMPVWAWILIGAVALIPIILLSPVVAVIALVVLITGIVALTRGTRTWLRLNSRKAAIAVTAAAAGVLLVTGSVSAAVLPNTGAGGKVEAAPFAELRSPEDAQRSEESRDARPTPTPTPTPVASTRDEVVTEVVPFTETRVDDGALPAGQTQVRTPGQNGERSLTYRVHLLDGQEVSRELISDVITTEPITQVIANGTYVAPPPPPAPAPAAPAGNCDSNYADACVPIDSDVDCAGGSGNGPSYFNGIARVVGSDIYDLDRDGDGLACEPY
ncbi:G5 domain-containing protein [Microbacterium sp. PRC9]|nr:G5 domain-containing protein [Microbacterium sp. PRC9]MDT0143225.1 G5 domain-containing protein [Microbacterium sp. PRC9]